MKLLRVLSCFFLPSLEFSTMIKDQFEFGKIACYVLVRVKVLICNVTFNSMSVILCLSVCIGEVSQSARHKKTFFT